MVTKEQAQAVLDALAEEFVHDIPTKWHNGRGYIEVTELQYRLLWPGDDGPDWVEQIAQYASEKLSVPTE